MPWTENTMTDIFVSGCNWIMLSRERLNLSRGMKMFSSKFCSEIDHLGLIQNQKPQYSISAHQTEVPQPNTAISSTSPGAESLGRKGNLENVKYSRRIRQDQGGFVEGQKPSAALWLTLQSKVRENCSFSKISLRYPMIGKSLRQRRFRRGERNLANTSKAKPKTKGKSNNE